VADTNNYVYTYIDPNTAKVFYVGRGIGGRMLDRNHNEAVMQKVAALGLTLNDVARKYREGLTADEAQRVEAGLIFLWGLDNLLNRRLELTENKYATNGKKPSLAHLIEHLARLAEGGEGRTDGRLVSLLWDKIAFNGGDILNPCGGMGTLLEGREGTIIENDNRKAGLAMASNAQLNVVNADYLEWKAEKAYDLIIMNPPFNLGAKMILKAVSELKDGGTLAFIMQSTWRVGGASSLYSRLQPLGSVKDIFMLSRKEAREYFSLGDRGTDIDLVVFTKCENETLTIRNNEGAIFSVKPGDYPTFPPFHREWDKLFSSTGVTFKTPLAMGSRTNKIGTRVMVFNSTSPFWVKEKQSAKKQADTYSPKTIVVARRDVLHTVCFDEAGTEPTVDGFLIYPLVKEELREEFATLLLNLGKTSNNTNSSRVYLPPFREEWFI